jgi:hypothetical protein
MREVGALNLKIFWLRFQIRSLGNLRKTLLQKLMDGEVRVR